MGGLPHRDRIYRCYRGALLRTGQVRKICFVSVPAMPPIVKENEIPAAGIEPGQRSSPGDSAVKQQPVALEVPVSVNGARALEGSDKREPFAESTKTVLIFGNGAVIRLSSSVAPGQLLFLTNERTKKEVVCQVVKSKNYRSVSGYVELEFTEPVVGFWGMRFPGDRIGSAPQSVTPAPARPVAAAPPLPQVPVALKPADLLVEKPVAPAAPLSSKLATSFDPEAPLKVPSEPPVSAVPVVPAAPVAAAPEFPMSSVPDTSATPGSVLFDSPRVSEAKASFLEPAKTPGAPATPSM